MIRTADFDYVIVGTGPAGATLASDLARAGKHICLIESGHKTWRTGFAAIGPRISTEENAVPSVEKISIASARILGGTSFVSMGNAVSPPALVLDEWGIDLGADLEAARRELQVNPVPKQRMGDGTLLINEAAFNLGLKPEPMPKCVDFARCTGCGQCMFGCPSGAKWTARAAVNSAVAAGTVLRIATTVTSATSSNGIVDGILAKCSGKTIRITGQRVIVAAGALNTPRILAASGIPGAGNDLSVDIQEITYGYTKETGMQNEMVMASWFPDLLSQQGFFTAPFMYVPYIVVRDMMGGFPREMRFLEKARILSQSRRIRTERLVGLVTKIRDAAGGRILEQGGVSKSLGSQDRTRLDYAFARNREILIGAGADPLMIFRGIVEGGHPCGTAAIGRVVNLQLETGLKNLFVCDASVFPTPLGVPPILTIVALAKRLGRQLLSGRGEDR